MGSAYDWSDYEDDLAREAATSDEGHVDPVTPPVYGHAMGDGPSEGDMMAAAAEAEHYVFYTVRDLIASRGDAGQALKAVRELRTMDPHTIKLVTSVLLTSLAAFIEHYDTDLRALAAIMQAAGRKTKPG